MNSFIDSKNSETTCQADSQWSTGPVKCLPKNCRSPPSVGHAHLSTPNFATTYPTELQYSCNEGYLMNGKNLNF